MAFITVRNGYGDDVLVNASTITYVETVGDQHSRREGFDALKETRGCQHVVSIIKLNNGGNEYTIPCMESAYKIERLIEAAAE